MMGGQSTHMPLKVNAGGVIPVIFASSILTFPATFAGAFAPESWMAAAVRQIAYGMPLYNLLYVTGIIFFASSTCRSSSIRMKCRTTCARTAASFRASGPVGTGRLHRHILTKITVVGAVYLSILCLILRTSC